MDEKDRHPTVRRPNHQPRQTTVGTDASRPTTLWRMRSGTLDNEAS